MTAWRWVLPSFADICFLVFLVILAFSPLNAGLLGDADTGWHIRTGQQIMATHKVPRTDPFSYTMAGKTWYAWEWLSDLAIAAAHQAAGLNGVVFVTAAVISLTFALLFHFLLLRTQNLAVALLLTLMAAAASQVHMLARPHVFSWLLALLWVECLLRFSPRRPGLLWLPLLMLFWVNLHAGWVLGLVLLGIFAVEPVVNKNRQALRLYVVVSAGCLAATLATPYGYRLHLHVYHYLSDRFLMNSIDEFQSPDFHQPVYLYFAAFVPLSLAAVALGRERPGMTQSLLWLFSLYAGLYAARNIPIAAILLSMVLGPLLASAVPRLRCLHMIEDISHSMRRLDRRLQGHALVIVFLASCMAIVCDRGRLLRYQVMHAHFNEHVYPAAAADVIARQGIHGHLFTSDSWGAYLIYRLGPSMKVFFDDRHDLYGEAFVREYGVTVAGMRQWQQPLDRYRVQWVLMPVDASLSSLLRSSPRWRPIYDDGVAILFARKPL